MLNMRLKLKMYFNKEQHVLMKRMNILAYFTKVKTGFCYFEISLLQIITSS